MEAAFFFNKCLFLKKNYLAAPGLSCDTWDLCRHVQVLSSSMLGLGVGPGAGVEPGMEPGPPGMEPRPPGIGSMKS